MQSPTSLPASPTSLVAPTPNRLNASATSRYSSRPRRVAPARRPLDLVKLPPRSRQEDTSAQAHVASKRGVNPSQLTSALPTLVAPIRAVTSRCPTSPTHLNVTFITSNSQHRLKLTSQHHTPHQQLNTKSASLQPHTPHRHTPRRRVNIPDP